MTDRYENIRKALAMTEDLDDLMCPHSAAGRPERFPAKACILAGECGCVYGAEWPDRVGSPGSSPVCTSQFRAIPLDAQRKNESLRDALTGVLEAVKSDE